MTRQWPEPVERVAAFLRETAAEVRIEEFDAGTPTADAAARAIGCAPSRIVKSLVLECDGAGVLAMVPGDRRVDPRKVAAAAGARVGRIAPAPRVRELTGLEPGAVTPFALPGIGLSLLDSNLLALDRVWVGAGSARHMARLAPAELLRITRGLSRDISADD